MSAEARIVLLVNAFRTEAVDLATRASEWCVAHEISIEVFKVEQGDDELPVSLEGFGLAVSVGGDGTFLRLASLAHAADIPILGVHFGRVGYLLEIEPARFLDVLGPVLAGEVPTEDRAVLEIEAADPDRRWMVLNEAVVEKTVPGHLVHLSTTVDGEAGLDYDADGVLFATPTGSTAYNLSAGGPVLAPGLRSMVLTPVAPHRSIGHSIVFPPTHEVTVRVEPPRPAALVLDGRGVAHLEPGDAMRVRVSPTPLRTVALAERTFLGKLRSTFAVDGRT